MGNVGILKSQLFVVLVFVFSLGLITIAVASPPEEALVATAWKAIELKATYRHYDYNNDTPVRTFTPVEGDATPAPFGPVTNTPFGFNRKNVEVSGTWFFARKSSAFKFDGVREPNQPRADIR